MSHPDRPSIPTPRLSWPLIAVIIVLVACVAVLGTLLVVGTSEGSPGDQVGSEPEAAPGRPAASTSTSTTVTTTVVQTTTTMPATTTVVTSAPSLPPVPTSAVPATDPQDQEPAVRCISGSISIENIQVTPGEYPDTYDVTAVVVNRSDAPMDIYGASLIASNSTYPDRLAETVDIYADVTEVRPGESMPMSGSFLLYPPGTALGRVWWDDTDASNITAVPRVDGDWAKC